MGLVQFVERPIKSLTVHLYVLGPSMNLALEMLEVPMFRKMLKSFEKDLRGLGFRVSGLGCLGFWVWGLGCVGFRV